MMTATRMATPRGPIPVTADTFKHGAGVGNAERRHTYTLQLHSPVTDYLGNWEPWQILSDAICLRVYSWTSIKGR